MNLSTDNLIKFLTTLGLAAIIFSVSFWYYSTDDHITKSLSNHLARTELEAEIWRLNILKDDLEISMLNTFSTKSYQIYEFKNETEYNNALSDVQLIRYSLKKNDNGSKATIDSLNKISTDLVKNKFKQIEYKFDEKIRSKNLFIIKFGLILLGTLGVFLFFGGIFFWYKIEFKVVK